MKNLIRFQGAVAQLARAPALQAGCRGFEPLRLHQWQTCRSDVSRCSVVGGKRAAPMYRGAPLSAANVPLRDVAVLRCRTLIEISGSNGLSNQVRADFWQTSSNLAGTSTAKPHGMPEAANVPLRCVAVLRCRTLIERSSVTGRAVRYESVFDRHHPISQARVRRSRTECRRRQTCRSDVSRCSVVAP